MTLPLSPHSPGSVRTKEYKLSDGTTTTDFWKWHEDTPKRAEAILKPQENKSNPTPAVSGSLRTPALSDETPLVNFLERREADLKREAILKQPENKTNSTPSVSGSVRTREHKLSDGTITTDFWEWNEDQLRESRMENPNKHNQIIGQEEAYKNSRLLNSHTLDVQDPSVKCLKFRTEEVRQRYYEAEENKYLITCFKEAFLEVVFNNKVDAKRFQSQIESTKGYSRAFLCPTPEGVVCLSTVYGEGHSLNDSTNQCLKCIKNALGILKEEKPHLEQVIDQFAKNVMGIK